MSLEDTSKQTRTVATISSDVRMYRRIGKWILFLGILGGSVLVGYGEWISAASFTMGCLVGFWGYQIHIQLISHALKLQRVPWMKMKVFGRFVLIAVMVYAMMRFLVTGVVAFLAGLLLPAVGTMIEMVIYLSIWNRRRDDA